MIVIGRSDVGLFGGVSLAAHLIRGVVAAAALSAAIYLQASAPVASLALGAVALAALRGCPVCWTLGLVEIVGSKLARKKG